MYQLAALFLWIAGIILAKGFVSTLVAIFFPLWAWIVVVYNLLLNMGWL
jgi:hypothetical protein